MKNHSTAIYISIIIFLLFLMGLQGNLQKREEKKIQVTDTIVVHDTITDTLLLYKERTVKIVDTLFVKDTTTIFKYYPKYVFQELPELRMRKELYDKNFRIELNLGARGKKPQFGAKFIYNF